MVKHFLTKYGWEKLNRIIHGLFEVTILIKGINGVWEIAAGLIFFFFSTQHIYRLLVEISGFGIVRHTGHFTRDYLMNVATDFSLSTQYFLGAYFLFYGVVNIFLMVSLLRGKLWAYPAAIMFFIIFIVYQFYRFFLYGSWLLLFFTLFDIFLVFLTWLEYKRVMKVALENSPKT